jgi:hypothetical protein
MLTFAAYKKVIHETNQKPTNPNSGKSKDGEENDLGIF